MTHKERERELYTLLHTTVITRMLLQLVKAKSVVQYPVRQLDTSKVLALFERLIFRFLRTSEYV